jgi:hypothetical protein
VLDLAEDHPVDGYEVPDRMRGQVFLRMPREVFPYSGGPSRGGGTLTTPSPSCRRTLVAGGCRPGSGTWGRWAALRIG